MNPKTKQILDLLNEAMGQIAQVMILIDEESKKINLEEPKVPAYLYNEKK